MINKTFQLLRTNPALTTNVKLVVSSDNKLYLESFDTNTQLADQKYKHYQISKEQVMCRSSEQQDAVKPRPSFYRGFSGI